MAIDPRIPLMGQPVQAPDILGTMGRVAQIKRLEAISQQEQQEMALRQKALEDDEKVKAIFSEPGITLESALPRLRAIDLPRAIALEKMLTEQAGTSLLNEGRQLANTKATLAQKEDEQAKAIITKHGGLTPEAFTELEALNPVRAMELKKLSLEGQPTLKEVEIDENGQTVIANYDPKAGTVTSTGVKKGTKPSAAGTQGSVDDLIATWTQEHGRPPTYAEKVKIVGERGKADDRPIRISTGGSGSGLSPTAESNIINRLTTQWTRASGPMREMDRQVNMMKKGLAAAERGDMPQGTEAVLQTFLKILDPGSVVREGEFFRLREGQSYLARAESIVQRLSKGGFVPLGELQAYARLAEEISSSQKGYSASVKKRLGLTADRYKIPHELVFEDDGSAAAPAPTAAPKANPFRKK